MADLEEYIKLQTFSDKEMLNRTVGALQRQVLENNSSRRFATKIKDREVRDKFTGVADQIVPETS